MRSIRPQNVFLTLTSLPLIYAFSSFNLLENNDSGQVLTWKVEYGGNVVKLANL